LEEEGNDQVEEPVMAEEAKEVKEEEA